MAISEVPSSPSDTSRRLFPAKNKKKRKKAKGTKRPPVQLRFMLSPLPKHSSARDQGTASKGPRGEASPTTAPVETVIESEEEEETAEPELQTCPVPSKLYDISGAHNPYWYKFIKLVPRPEFEHLHKPGNKHARAAYCTKCSAEVHFEKGRSHVKMHLQVHHPAYLRDCEEKKKTAKDAKVTIASGAPHSTPSKKKRVVAVTPEQQRRANQYLALWIAKNMRPLVIVEDEGLAFYVRYITETLGGISLKVPGRTQVRVDIVQLAVELRAELKGMIKEGCRYYAVTTDIWTSLTTEGYVSLTLHYFDLKFRPCNWTLEIERFPGLHSGEAIAEGLTKLFKRWGLDPSFCIKLVRDGASNGVLAGNLMGVPHMSCIAHSLHLVVGGALIKRTRKASGVANSSGLVTERAPESPQRMGGAAAALAATTPPGVAVVPAVLVLPAPPGVAGGPVGPVFPAPPAIVEQVAVPCEDDTKRADTEAEPWEQDRSIQELADFLRQWHVMEQLYALDEVRDLVQRFRSLATYFHSSQKATSCLNAIQKRLIAEYRTGEDELHARARQPLKVVTDCPTRWNSARDMLARMIELKQPLKGCFRHLKTAKGKKEFQRMPKLFRPDAKDWFTIKCLIALLDPIAATSELLGGQGYPTLALAFPCLRQIERTVNRDDLFDEEALLVEDAPFKQTVLDLMTTVRLAFVGLFERRFADLPTDLLWISYLDPRLTNMEGLTNDQCKEATTGLIDAAIALAKQENLNQSQSPQPDKDSNASQGSSIPKKQRTTAVEGVFGKRVRRDAQASAAAREKRLKTRCSAEVYRYLDEVADTEFDADPLEWWRLHGRSYPYLAPLARQWLACVATSVPSERAFSSAGNIVNCKRTKLDPSLVRDLLFIHDNFEFPEWETDEKATSDPSHEQVNQSK